MANDLTRRDVLRTAAVGAAGIALGLPAAATRPKSPNDRIRFACIGVGGKGRSDAGDCARLGEVVAICDVDAQTRAKGLAAHPRAAAFADFRQMLEALDRHIDAVTVSTPDHTHAVAAAMALQMGKHVFCQKPLTRTLGEARRLRQLAQSSRVATQMGNQGTAHDDLRRAAAAIRAGAFGAVREVHCWTDRAGGWWKQGVERPPSKVCPDHVDFDLWLGPAPKRPFAEGYHPFHWRGWWHFGSGALGDIGCHNMNLPFMALDLRDPASVIARTSGHNGESYPVWSIVEYDFPARGDRGPVKLTWYDGGKRPPQDFAPDHPYQGNGALIVCEKATLYSPNEYGTAVVLTSGEPMPDIPFERSPGHFDEWVEAIRGGRPARSNIVNYSGPLTETVLLGNLAVWAAGTRIEWDARRLAVKGQPDLDELIRPDPRRGWEL